VATLHRKNSLFYKTLNGARVGDLFMSLIHTCELNGANPLDYLPSYRGTPRSCGEAQRGGCRGITARRWRGWHDLPPHNIMFLPSRKGSTAAKLEPHSKMARKRASGKDRFA
jgi:hypothetical protein